MKTNSCWKRSALRKRAIDVALEIEADPRNPRHAVHLDHLAVVAQRAKSPCAEVLHLGLRSFWLGLIERHEEAHRCLDRAEGLEHPCPLCAAEVCRRRAYVDFLAATVGRDLALFRRAAEGAGKAEEIYLWAASGELAEFAVPLRSAVGATLVTQAKSAFFLGQPARSRELFARALQLTKPGVASQWPPPPCVCLPTDENREHYHANAFSNLAIMLAQLGTPAAIQESLEMLPAVRRSYRAKDHLPRAKVDWLAGKLAAARWPGPGDWSPQQRQSLQRLAVRKYSRGLAGLLEFGSPADAVMCLLELCACPWVRSPEEEVLVRFGTRDPEQRELIEAQLAILDRTAAAKIASLREEAEYAAREIGISQRQSMGARRRQTIADAVRERVWVRLHRTMRWLVAAGALPPIHRCSVRSPTPAGRPAPLRAPGRSRFAFGEPELL